MKQSTIKRLLIANRGEIACRIIRTTKAMGIETIAVYSDADYKSLHKELADISVNIGPASASDSYLKIDHILQAAQQHKADAIHPGYGFLSENAELAQACEQQGIFFVGPDANAITAMGSKSQAKQIMGKASVPMVPGYHGDDQSNKRLAAEAEKTGFPLLIKAAYGGGGKGMRVVKDSAFFIQELDSARREASKAFGNDRMLLERFVTTARHVEVQVFFDHHGNGVYLFDRDCSLQRRHQKVIEEAPAPGLSDALRKQMGKAAVAAGKAINYRGAGTVEFLLEGEHFYFMEMNTRLQVEHPVTEMVTGVDLVQWQLKVAAGEVLPLTQSQLKCTGHAIEGRLYAEDPYHDFLPASGRVMYLHWPESQAGLRVDAGIQAGDTITSQYDPMVAKVIAHGRNRDEAIERLIDGIRNYHQAGIKDNRDFLIHLLQQPQFKSEQINTHFVELHPFVSLSPVQQRQLLVAAALYLQHGDHTFSHWQQWQTSSRATVYLDDEPVTVGLTRQGKQYQLVFPDGHCAARAEWYKEVAGLNGTIHMINTPQSEFSCRVVPLPGQRIKVFLPDFSYELGLPGYNAGKNPQHGHGLTAPMNGTVSKIMVQEGDTVDQGASLMIVEAMKMEHCIKAPEAGTVAEILFQPGDRVEAGITLLTFRDDNHEAA